MEIIQEDSGVQADPEQWQKMILKELRDIKAILQPHNPGISPLSNGEGPGVRRTGAAARKAAILSQKPKRTK